MSHTTEVLDVINKKIKEIEVELKELNKAKLIFLGEGALSQKKLPFKNPRYRGKSKYSIGTFAVKIIKEAGKPLHVKEIGSKLLEQGVHISTPYISTALYRLCKDSVLKKTYPNTFDLI